MRNLHIRELAADLAQTRQQEALKPGTRRNQPHLALRHFRLAHDSKIMIPDFPSSELTSFEL